MSNEIVKKEENTKISFTNFITSNTMSKKINEIIGDPKKGATFISSIVSAVNTNPTLAQCDNASILSGALLGASLNLSPSPQLGNYYLIPFDIKRKDNNGNEVKIKVAQFQLGWKGYYQLALRSGQYKKLNVIEIKEGELVSWNPLEEELEVNIIEDDEKREKLKTIGYYAFYENTQGFRKCLYWSKEKMEAHALQYSQGYKADKQKKTQYTFWSKSFDEMAKKTMLRQLISKYGVMSIEMQNAYESDMAYIKEDGTKEYVDNEDITFEVQEQPKEVSLDDISE